jgi:SPX domain protein involved in polyphosphate accumulation
MVQKQLDSPLRFERKYIIERGYSYIFSDFLKKNFFKKAYDSRIVNSIYYDNFTHDAFSENLSGISVRKKTRLRWYDEHNLNLNLETKFKNNMMNSKNILNKGVFKNLIELKKFLRKKLLTLTNGISQPMEPILKIRYHRSYFISKCGSYRATVDSKVNVSDIFGNFNFGKEMYLKDDVMEFKYPLNKDLSFRKESFLIKNPFRLQKNSKYISGYLNLKEAGLK